MAEHECIQGERIERVETDVRELRRTINGKLDKVVESITSIRTGLAVSQTNNKWFLVLIIAGTSTLTGVAVKLITKAF